MADGQNRKACVTAILELIRISCDPDAIGIAEYGGNSGSGYVNLGYAPTGFTMHKSHDYSGSVPPKKRELALFLKDSTFSTKLEPTSACGDLRHITLGYNGLNISTFHIGSKVKQKLRQDYQTGLQSKFIAFGDWNKGPCFMTKPFGIENGNVHPLSVGVQHYDSEIQWLGIPPNLVLFPSTCPLPPPSTGKCRHTLLKKSDTGNTYQGKYDPSGWTDLFIAKGIVPKSIKLIHFHFSPNLIKDQAFGKDTSNRSRFSIAPSNHLPILIEFEPCSNQCD